MFGAAIVVLKPIGDGIGYPTTGKPVERKAVFFWTDAILIVMLAPVFTTGYAVLKHQVLDIHVVIRRGVRYLLTKNALRALLALLALGVGLLYQKRLSEWVDRRLFREAFDRERVLLQLIDQIREVDSADGISRRVSDELVAALHPSSLYLFYRSGRAADLALDYSSGGSGDEIRLSRDASVSDPVARYPVRLDPVPVPCERHEVAARRTEGEADIGRSRRVDVP